MMAEFESLAFQTYFYVSGLLYHFLEIYCDIAQICLDSSEQSYIDVALLDRGSDYNFDYLGCVLNISLLENLYQK